MVACKYQDDLDCTNPENCDNCLVGEFYVKKENKTSTLASVIIAILIDIILFVIFVLIF